MPRSVANLIYEYLAPEQPDYCRQASLEILAKALAVTGPVIHCGQVVSLGKGGKVDLEARSFEKAPATDDPVEAAPHDPTDADLAAQWGLPLASETPVPTEGAEPAPEAAHAPAKHRRPHRRAEAATDEDETTP